ncbi:MAG: metallophosphoesterase family protein [Eubacterium sp.]
MNKIVKIVAPVLLSAAVIAGSLGVYFGYAKTTDEYKEINVETKGEPLRVAVISDLQLPNSDDKESHAYKSFESTLTMLKNKGMDVLLIDGDFVDLATTTAWESYKEIYDNVMADSEKPVPLYILGNHDYWLDYFFKCWEIPTPAKMQKRFTKYTGEYPYSHKKINGYHFICWSSSNGSYDKSYSDEKWIREQLDQAVADDPTKPIFVITHLNPINTSYGSDEWGNEDINNVLKDYSQVISISGHSHFSLIDERTIWQGDYTAFTTQSLDYIELEGGKFNGSIPVDAYGNLMADKLPACLYMEIEDEKITIERLEANTGNTLKEPWVLEAPFDKPDKYTDKRAESNQAPVLDADLNASISDITDVDGNAQKMLSFKAGSDDDFVHSYKLQFLDENKNLLEFEETTYSGDIIMYNDEGETVSADDKNISEAKPKMITELLYFSDFVLGLNNMSATAELRLPSSMPENAKYIAVTAIDSWSAESESSLYEIK